jgi:tetratricopeptide (TPR) repeat protein
MRVGVAGAGLPSPCHGRVRLGALAGLLGFAALGPVGCAAQLRELAAQSEISRACAAHVDARRDVAEAGYRASMALVPSSAAANNLGVLAAERADLDGARAFFEQAVELDGDDFIARTNLGVVLFHLGRSGEAVESFMRAREARRAAVERILPSGRVNWEADRYLAATARAESIASRYLDRLMGASVAPEAALPDGTALARVLIVAPVRL